MGIKTNQALALGKGCQVESGIPIIGQLAADAGVGIGTTILIDVLQPNTTRHPAAAPVISGILSFILFDGKLIRKATNALISAVSSIATDVALNKAYQVVITQ